MSGDYSPIQHLLDEVDDYHIIIGLKDRIKDQLRRAYAIGFFHGPDPEGGTREPAGDSPDNPPAGEAGVPGGSDDYLPAENHPDDSAGIGHVIPLTKNSEFWPNGILVYDMVLPKWHGVPKDYWTPFRNTLAGSRADEGSTN